MLGVKSYTWFSGKKHSVFAYFIALVIIAYIVIFLVVYFWFPSNQNSNDTLRINSVTPNSGPTSGGTLVTIDGSGFVTFDQQHYNLDLDTTFNFKKGANGSIFATALQPDGKILIGGDFVEYDGIPTNRIARLNPDGSLDTSFNSKKGVVGSISIIALQPDSKILIGGGGFAGYNGTTTSQIARLNPDGSLDTSFNPTRNIHSIRAIALQPDGKILIGGRFTYYNNTPTYRIVRLNPDGSLDTNFNSGNGANNEIYTILLQPDGKILISGLFTKYNETLRNYIARLNPDGSLDSTFNPNKGANSSVNTIALQPDGKILIGGAFTEYDGTPRNRIARLNPDGSLDSSFNPKKGANDTILAIALQPDGKILIGGIFARYNDVPSKHLARLNPDGSLDASFNSENGTNFGIDTIILQSEDKILISGWFNQYNGIPVNRIIRINPTPGNRPPVVIIGDDYCTNVVLVSSSQLSCTTPSSGTTGKKDVVVINGDWRKAILRKGFTYDDSIFVPRYPF